MHELELESFFAPAAAALLGGIYGLFGGWDMLIKALIVCLVLDYLSGVIAAGIHQELSSAAGFRGILKKCAVLILVVLSATIDMVLGVQGILRGAVIAFFIANEGLSVVENVHAAGLPVPKKLIAMLKGMGHAGESTPKKEEDRPKTEGEGKPNEPDHQRPSAE